jgi:hypothetical protein
MGARMRIVHAGTAHQNFLDRLFALDPGNVPAG